MEYLAGAAQISYFQAIIESEKADLTVIVIYCRGVELPYLFISIFRTN